MRDVVNRKGGCCVGRTGIDKNNLVMQGLHAFLIWSYTRDTVLFVGPLYSHPCLWSYAQVGSSS